MRVLVACEYSGVVRDAFVRRGHLAISCDILDTESDSDDPRATHYQGDVRDLLASETFDLVVAHPPCTYLTCAGNRWFYHPEDKHLPLPERRPHPKYPTRREDQDRAVEFVEFLWDSCSKVAVENPVGVLSTRFRKPDQVIQPYQFGHKASKATCLWLKGLPPLVPTMTVDCDDWVTFPSGRRMERWAYDMSCLPHNERAKARSRTFLGIAEAMADQWG